jgi:twinkle protein
VEHKLDVGVSETNYISKTLTEIGNLSRSRDVASFIAAHPQKLYVDKETGKYKCPKPYDISGSAHWYNKADVCLGIHRELDNEFGEAEIHVQKSRFKQVGKAGQQAILYFDVASGRYSEPETDIGKSKESKNTEVSTDMSF